MAAYGSIVAAPNVMTWAACMVSSWVAVQAHLDWERRSADKKCVLPCRQRWLRLPNLLTHEGHPEVQRKRLTTSLTSVISALAKRSITFCHDEPNGDLTPRDDAPCSLSLLPRREWWYRSVIGGPHCDGCTPSESSRPGSRHHRADDPGARAYVLHAGPAGRTARANLQYACSGLAGASGQVVRLLVLGHADDWPVQGPACSRSCQAARHYGPAFRPLAGPLRPDGAGRLPARGGGTLHRPISADRAIASERHCFRPRRAVRGGPWCRLRSSHGARPNAVGSLSSAATCHWLIGRSLLNHCSPTCVGFWRNSPSTPSAF